MSFSGSTHPAALALSLAAFVGLAAVETEQQTGPNDARVSFELNNKHYDQGVIWVDDVTSHYQVLGRLYGFGITLDGWTAIGEDTTAKPAKVAGLETTELKIRVDYLLEVPFAEGVPMLQVLPHYEGILYPNQRPSSINNDQQYVGVDGWFQPPILGFEGFEFGGGVDFNVDRKLRSFRGAIGARQFLQAAPVDIALHELVTFGNAAYWRNLSGIESKQVGVLDIGGKLTMPLAWREWWAYVKVSGYYWLDGDQRTLNRNNGVDNGGVLVGIGIQWWNERR
ncbi:hypothetical protein LBMAG53_04790 [Planctomycetota bacterium]|nr:hypothetical protein LBMAG53_04790 [Planctomycetota bacterium]